MTEDSGEAVEYYKSIGPWATAESVAKYCNLTADELLRQTEEQRLLGVEFADGKYYYPSLQFKDGGPVPGLERILAVLATAYRAPASQVAWLAAEAYEDDDITRWDVLHQEKVELLLSWARTDTDWVNRP